MVEHDAIARFIEDGLKEDALGVVEGYDYGQVSPSCYLLAFFDDIGNVYIADGFHRTTGECEASGALDQGPA